MINTNILDTAIRHATGANIYAMSSKNAPTHALRHASAHTNAPRIFSLIACLCCKVYFDMYRVRLCLLCSGIRFLHLPRALNLNEWVGSDDSILHCLIEGEADLVYFAWLKVIRLQTSIRPFINHHCRFAAAIVRDRQIRPWVGCRRVL